MELYKCLVCNEKVTTSKRTKICIVCRRKLYTEKDFNAINDYLRKLQESVNDVPLLPGHRIKKERVSTLEKIAEASSERLPITSSSLPNLLYREKIFDSKIKQQCEGNGTLQRFLVQHKSEREFVENYFNHDQWVHHPATFYLSTCAYVPDFYDKVRGVFIEVTATRQAYMQNKHKYFMMREEYPLIPFEVRRDTGMLVNIDEPVRWKTPQITLRELREMSPGLTGLETIKVPN